MPKRNLVWKGPGPLGEPDGRVLFELLDATKDGCMVTVRNRESFIPVAEGLQRRGYLDKLEMFGRGGFRCNVTQKGLDYGRRHFGWTEA